MGVTILAVLAIIGGLLGLLAACGLIGLGSFAAASGVTTVGIVGAGAIILGILYLLVSAGELGFGIGAWTRQPWAWTAGVASQAGVIVINVLDMIMGGGFVTPIISIIIAAAIIYYLFTPEIKAYFGRP
jgi:hypothetical protein